MIFPFHDDNPIRRTPFLTFGIIGLNAVVFLGSLQLGPGRQALLWYQRGFVPARIAQLADPKPLVVDLPPEVAQELPRRLRPGLAGRLQLRLSPSPSEILLSLLTCMFLHGGWWHLIGNMWFLWVFGNNVEDRLGHAVFLLFYLCGGVFASACHWMIEPSSTIPVIGASGAVATMLGAYAITWPWARVKCLVFLFVIVTIIDLPALLVLGAWFVMQMVSAANLAELEMGGGVAWWAHVGGFLAGLLVMPVLTALGSPAGGARSAQPRSFDFKPPRQWRPPDDRW